MTNTQKLSAQPRSWEAGEALREAIRTLTPFTTSGALRGDVGTPCGGTGVLPEEYVARMRDDEDHIDYVVWSYATPIAWHLTEPTPDGATWVIPDVYYSHTTSRHQTQVRLATD